MERLLTLEEPPPAPQQPGFALWALGFRPFYLLASVFAAASVGLWALQFSGVLGQPYLAGPIWHAHEMLFGFTLAVIVGFLYTAGRNWTGLPTPTGTRLAALAALWLAARILVLSPYVWSAALANVLFPLVAAAGLVGPFVKAGNRRNYFFIALLVLMAGAAAVIHASQLGLSGPLPGRTAVQVALDIVLFIVAVMAGRVVPMFTNNGVRGAAAGRRAWLEQAALAAVLALLVLDAAGIGGGPLIAVGLIGAVAHLARWLLWQPWRTWRVPLVWVLHLAYAWIPVHLALRAAAAGDGVLPSLASHALTVGAIGGLVIGMITRTAKGHTGRPLQADRYDVACYVLVALAAAVRVLVPLLAPGGYLHAVEVSALMWSAGFGLYAVRYWPVLTRPRLDGRPG